MKHTTIEINQFLFNVPKNNQESHSLKGSVTKNKFSNGLESPNLCVRRSTIIVSHVSLSCSEEQQIIRTLQYNSGTKRKWESTYMITLSIPPFFDRETGPALLNME